MTIRRAAKSIISSTADVSSGVVENTYHAAIPNVIWARHYLKKFMNVKKYPI